MTTTPPVPDHFAARSYEVRHRTTYTYDLPCEAAYERGMIDPRETPAQTIRETSLTVTPEPDAHTEHLDYFGNHSAYIEVRTPHTTLELLKKSIVDVARARPDLDHLNQWTVAEAAALVAERADPVEAADFLLPSPLVELAPAVKEYALTMLPPDRGLGDGIMAVTTGIFADFRYDQKATTVRTTLPELLKIRRGVCQDFAQLAIGCFRSVGLPARYVSGYVETYAPPGQKKLEGSDASHAWTGVWTPDGTWIDLDPTNNHLVDSRYVITAWGRDFRDVSPLRGVIHTEAKNSKLKVGVDVIPLGLRDAS
ncbi:transglutaminase family protein [Nigerium massiliense]|uniref:transglutaminase family protein n=1 Tax=Nigerium massiliense TaxID=1522317 RepID=UPI00058C7EAF|nr:transglutaminase family protein [Nigerium massiliense]